MGDTWNKKYSKLTINQNTQLDIKTVRQLMRRHQMCINTIFYKRQYRYKKQQTTFLHHAIETKNVKLINWLVARKVDPNISPRNQWGPPIIVALWKNDLATIRKLVNLGARVNVRQSGVGFTPLYRYDYDHDDKITEFMIKNGADVNMEVSTSREHKRYSPLQMHLETGDEELINLLLSRGADVNHKSADGFTPLLCAAPYVNLETFKQLLYLGADVHCKSIDGSTALICASKRGNREIVEFLLDHGADINSTTSKGLTPLLGASWCRNVELIKLLLDRGATIRCKLDYGDTPLVRAAWGGNLEVVKILLDHGAEINCAQERSNDIYTPLHLALKSRNLEVIEFLFNFYEAATPAKLLTIKDRKTMLHYMFYDVNNLSEEVIEFLLDVGVDVNLEERNGMLAIDYYTRNWVIGKEFYSTMKKHFVKLLSADLPLCKRNNDVIGDGLEDFATNCRDEVNKMKNTKIGDVHTSFYDVLHLSEHKLVIKVKCLKSDFHSKKQLREKFPLYGGMLFYKLAGAQKKMKRREKAEEKLAEILLCWNLPYDFLRELFNYLTECDLRMIIGEKIPDLSKIINM